MKYIVTPLKECFNITGKASLKEFWFFFIFYMFLSFLLGLVRGFCCINEFVTSIIRISLLVPFITLGFRRLNETKFSKWMFLIPIVNLILASLPAESK